MRRKGLLAGKRCSIGRNSVRKLSQMFSSFAFCRFLLLKAREFNSRVIICDKYCTT